MKSIEKISAYSLTVVLLLFVSLSSYGQSRQDKTKFIIDSLRLTEVQKMNYGSRLKTLKYHTTGIDSVKLVEMEKQLTDENISKVISGVFDELLSEEEVNDIYNFIHSSAYEKFFQSGKVFKLISTHYKDFDKEIERITNNMDVSLQNPFPEFNPIPVDREDGFYATKDDVHATGVKEIKLEDQPSLTSKDILEAKKVYDQQNIKSINIQFTKEGSQKYYLFTKENIGRSMAIVIAKQIVWMPTINMAIMGGRVGITGRFTDDEVDDMMARLKEKK